VTPFTADDHLNEPALRRLTQHLLAGGVHGLFAVGSQGEFWALSADEKRRVWEIVVEEARGNVPVYAGTAAVTTREAIALTRAAEGAGVAAVSVLTPYFVSPSEDELYAHYRAIAASTRLPVVLYANPARTGVRISPRLVTRLAAVENIMAIKDSSGELELAAEYVRVAPPHFGVLMGRDTLILAGLLYGATGAIAATANVVPRLVVDIYERFQAGDLAGARQAQERLAPLRMAFSWGTFPVVIKEALDLMGLEVGPARAPVGPLPDDKRARLRDVLRELGALQ
jgi:4-hydroxy-tetrahydrodipicolinate synthase